ncbi:MAG: carbohydrate kinase family protein [Verrucomicrobia bacterium]|nr:carbohydrate kinase family protein [Verrucomicrobiota bacterium]
MFRQRTLQQIAARRAQSGTRTALVGFDGFVDTIVTPVGLRRGPGENFTPISTLGEFGQRIVAAAGKSTNIELYPRIDKLGGNGPIMANALLAAGTQVTYVGALGTPVVHPVFADMASRARTFSLCDAAHTTAVECDDAKLMLGIMRSLDEVTFERICRVMGEATFQAEVAGAGLLAFVNWTMIPNMTAIFTAIVDQVLPKVPANPDRIFFFDLADPEKRSVDDLRAALAAIGRFGKFGHVTLGLNLKEAQQVATALGLTAPDRDETTLRAAAGGIRAKLGVSTVVIHPTESAACATAAGTAWVPGPFTAKPLITTGAGDHFNAGFTTGQLLRLDPEACLALGVSTSGHYVRTGESPSLAKLETFLANWR